MAPFSVERLVKSIERCLAIKSLEREKRDFISMLSHDLKTRSPQRSAQLTWSGKSGLARLTAEQGSYLLSAIESCNEVVAMIDKSAGYPPA